MVDIYLGTNKSPQLRGLVCIDCVYDAVVRSQGQRLGLEWDIQILDKLGHIPELLPSEWGDGECLSPP